ncbi:AAA family ATPase [Candidatus Kaiserbacteria bacterium CG10_big_fil_rev_8_21_14_0_10_44_10]|uniref:AAA family ATPase n=1 Tax=Candidatus Kaiserbacteria bacterium CG10_big_fil_rev_8_21_14_0_10_44_10 TaxID=1974606 RepID=A0A2H0UKL4_9BACT|nr:MAG: AAA family ATPase [Candidatus Kaiserbacteria bacterium CG10_big_fil_rev_8_21_14_0_10_44_10]
MVNLYPMTQNAALDILKTGANVFLTGEPGAGKTFVINQYIAWLEAAGLSVAVTASTGIAATHIGGMTIHSWSGIGIRDTLTQYDLDKISTNEKVTRRAKKANVLVIDEVSMLDGKILDMVNLVLKTVRQREEPFGGIQVVFVGDFFQLPPVTRRGDSMLYSFQSRAWSDAQLLTCYLSEQHRQEDSLFLGLLKSIRLNQVEEDHYTLLSEQTSISYENIEPTKLYTHNADVDTFNNQKLRELAGHAKTFRMHGKGGRVLVESLMRNCLSPETLELKEEAMVMFTKNNFEKGYVNGTLGRVIDFDRTDGWPIVKTSDGRTIKAESTSWEVAEDGKVRATIEQVPLRLAWGITVHKSQGMSLDAAEIDLSKAFVYGQGYVALSRVRALAGLKLSGMNPNALSVDPRVVAQDVRFKDDSQSAEDVFNEMSDEELLKLHTNFVKAGGGKLPKPEEVKAVEAGERVKKESTHEITKRMLLEKMSVDEIAKSRKMAASTIWSHVEDLINQEQLLRAEIAHLTPTDWEQTWPHMQKAIEEVGDEKLKPIFEYLKEKYDYDQVRLGRIYWRLTTK